MNRNKDLVRQLLLEIEQKDNGRGDDVDIDYDGVDEAVIMEHLRLLKEAALIEAFEVPGIDDIMPHFIPSRLTWNGHEYLDLIRDPEVWAKTKDGASKVGGFSVELLGELAKGLVRQKIKQHTGVEV